MDMDNTFKMLTHLILKITKAGFIIMPTLQMGKESAVTM